MVEIVNTKDLSLFFCVRWTEKYIASWRHERKKGRTMYTDAIKVFISAVLISKLAQTFN